MYINPLNIRYSVNSLKNDNESPKVDKPAFKAELSSVQYQTVLERLKKVNKNVIPSISVDTINEIVKNFLDKYERIGVRSVAMQVIGKKELADFLGEKAADYDLKNKIGVCIAVGDRRGPVESMTNIYESALVLASEEDLYRDLNQ